MYANQITIRPAALADLDFIQELSREVFNRYGPYDKILTDWFQLEKPFTLLAVIEGCPVGFAMLRLPEYNPLAFQRIGELLAIAVIPGKQGLGIGDRLMDEISTVAREGRIDILILSTAITNRRAQKLFKKHGFEIFRVEKGYYERGQEAMMMYKMISWPPSSPSGS